MKICAINKTTKENYYIDGVVYFLSSQGLYEETEGGLLLIEPITNLTIKLEND